MGAIVYQITSLNNVYSTVYSDAYQRKHQSSASLAFLHGIHRSPVNSSHKWPVTRKMFPFDDVIIQWTDPMNNPWREAHWLLHPAYIYIVTYFSGLILGLRPANERWCYFVTTSLNDLAQALSQPWFCHTRDVHCVTAWCGQFPLKSSRQMPHSSPVRGYGMSFVSAIADSYSTSITDALCVMSCYNGPRFDDTRLYLYCALKSMLFQ